MSEDIEDVKMFIDGVEFKMGCSGTGELIISKKFKKQLIRKMKWCRFKYKIKKFLNGSVLKGKFNAIKGGVYLFSGKVEKLYGLDYNRYICGGIGNAKIKKISGCRELFYTESEAIKRLSEVKGEVVFGDFELFTTNINKDPYKI